MVADGVFPPEMPDTSYDPAERLLGGRLDPEDAPPGYAEVATVLRAAAGPPCPDELAGQPAALATFRRVRHRARVRARLVTVALAGTLAIGGLWIADGAHSPLGLLSPSGGPGSGGPGSGAPAGTPGSGGAGSGGAGTAPALRAALPPVGAAAGEGGGGSPELPSTRERAIARHGGGGASRGGGSARGVRPATSSKGPTAKPPKPSKAEPGKAEPGKAEPGKAEPGKAEPGKAGEAGRGGGGEGR